MKKIRMYLGKKPLEGGQARRECVDALQKLSKMFSEDVLSRYGLKRDAQVFDDLMRGGSKAKQSYRALLENEYPVKSTLPYVAEEAQRQVEKALSELAEFVLSLIAAGRTYRSLLLSAEKVRFDEAEGCPVLTPEGEEELEDMEGYYATTKKQVQVYELAKKIVGDIGTLKTMLEGSRYSAISSSWNEAVLSVEGREIKIMIDHIASL